MACMQEQTGARFNAEAAIAAFLSDSARTCLELPHMTTGQRKQAKKLVEAHPELICESYGFGSERRLQLFKRSNKASPKAQLLPAELPLIDENSSSERDASADRSTTASSNEAASPCTGSSDSSPRYVHLSPKAVHVKNTFVHFQGTSADQRAVQSMPHGMFRQSLFEEAMRLAALPVAAHATSPTVDSATVTATGHLAGAATTSSSCNLLLPGREAIIERLSKCPQFNGQLGVIQSLDEATGRYNILITLPGGRQQSAKVKGDNLRPIVPLPPPPQFAPSVTVEECNGIPSFPSTPTWEDRCDSVHALRLTALV